MTVSELRGILRGCPDNAIVVLSSDPEGNSYSTLYTTDNGYLWVPDWNEIWDSSDPDSGEEPDGAQPALVLWP